MNIFQISLALQKIKLDKTCFILLSLLVLASCNSQKEIHVKKGVINIKGQEINEIAKVRGDFKFFWNSHLNTDEVDKVTGYTYINTGEWKKFGFKNHGFCTYNFKIIKDRGIPFSLNIYRILSAYKLFIDDSLVHECGIVGTSKETTSPYYKILIADLPPEKDTISIMLSVANFHYWKGGIHEILLGKTNSIHEQNRKRDYQNIFIIGGLLMLFLIFFTIFMFRRQEVLFLYYSFWVLVSALRISTYYQLILLEVFPSLGWEWNVKLELMSLYLYIGAGILFYKSYVFVKKRKLYDNLFLIISAFLALITLPLPADIHSNFLIIGKPFFFGVMVYSIGINIYMVIKKYKDAIFFTIGFFFFVLGAINEIFTSSNIYLFDPMFNYQNGCIFFFLSLVIVLSKRFQSAYNKAENLAFELQKTNANLEIKVEERTKELQLEKDKSDKLLLNVLPEPIAIRLKEGENKIADQFEEASIVFIDIVDFTLLSSKIPPQETVDILNRIFTELDKLSEMYQLEKIKTIGDCYMAVAGIPFPVSDHAERAANFAMEALAMVNSMTDSINVRIGIDCGPVVAGVIGEKKFIYDLWGDSVNTAARMEEYGTPNEIHITSRFKEKLEGFSGAAFKYKGQTDVKGKGLMQTWMMIKNEVEIEPQL